MKKILLIVSLGCLVSATATLAQTSASVLSPAAPTMKFTMNDAAVDPAAQTQNATPGDSKEKPAKKSKAEKKSKDDSKSKVSCAKDGCSGHGGAEKEEKACCKKDGKKKTEPSFIEEPKTPKKD